jgi:uncharacterized membrane protein
MANLWYVGVILEVLAGIAGTVGKQLVSFSARRGQSFTTKLCFIAGLCITTFIGPVFDAAAFAFAPQSIVAPLNGLDVCWNTLLAPFTLGETLRKPHVIGTALVATGAGLTAVFGPHGTDIQSVEDVSSKLFRTQTICYLVAWIVFLGGCYRLNQSRPQGVGDKLRGITLGVGAGAVAGNMYFCTCTVGLLRLGIGKGDWSAWTNISMPLPYILALCTLGIALSNVPIMAKGLQEYEALFMVTLFEGSHICVACFSGSIVLDEMQGLPFENIVCYWLAVLGIAMGLYILQTAPVKSIVDTPDGECESNEPTTLNTPRRLSSAFNACGAGANVLAASFLSISESGEATSFFSRNSFTGSSARDGSQIQMHTSIVRAGGA